MSADPPKIFLPMNKRLPEAYINTIHLIQPPTFSCVTAEAYIVNAADGQICLNNIQSGEQRKVIMESMVQFLFSGALVIVALFVWLMPVILIAKSPRTHGVEKLPGFQIH